MCQPSRRLSLKVLKAKNETHNFMYVGGQNAGLMDAALKVVGTEVVSHCTVREWPSDDNSAKYTLVALLAKDDSGKLLGFPIKSQSNPIRFHENQQRRSIL